MSASLSQALAEFASSCPDAAIPAAARRIALTGIVDAVGVMIAGSAEAAPAILRRELGSGAREAHIAFGSQMTGAADAAWIGGTAAHALDYDDVSIQGHPSAVMAPALFAQAEAAGASGAELVSAYVVGFETWAELVLREPDQHHRKGWHPTGLFGVIGAAAACGRLIGLTAGQMLNALGLAASNSAGVMANFGSMAKPLHAGLAARNGLMAARLAKAGMAASPDALHHAQGLLSAVSPGGRVDLRSPVQAGTRWRLAEHGLAIKKYPTCLSTHRTLDGLIGLAAARDLRPEEVRSVRISMSARNATILLNHRPKTGLEAKFSAEFAAAAALLAGRLTLAELDDSFVARRDVQSLIERVAISMDERENPVTGYAPYDEITVEMADGSVLSTRVSTVRGSAGQPLGEAELRDKFCCCVSAHPAGLDGRLLFDRLAGLEDVGNVRTFVAGLVPPSLQLRAAAV
jgi:2-methylcitrate dehydratase PrpD